MMSEVRINLTMSVQDSLIVMCGGNPGALTVCVGLIKEAGNIDPDSALGGLGKILSLDSLHIYEERIWMLFKDVCKQDLRVMVGVMRAWQLGFTTREALNHAIDNYGEGLDLPGLMTQVEEALPSFARPVEAE